MDSRLGAGFISGCDSQRAPKWEGVLMKLLLCAKPLIGMFLLKPYITPVGAKCLSFKFVQGGGISIYFFLPVKPVHPQSSNENESPGVSRSA